VDKGFSPEWIEKLKQNNDIITVANKYITLSKKGKTWWACCPFHFEKTPSFAINEVEQFYHCFGCGASGDVIKFVEKFETLDFYDACKKLAEYANMELPEFHNDENLVKTKKKRERIFQLLVDTARYYYNNLKSNEARPALEYLAKRKLDMSVVKEFGLGYSLGWNEVILFLKSKGYTEEEMIDSGVAEKKNDKLIDAQGKRLIFPIFNLYGNVVGFSARVLEKTDFAKYKNTTQTLVFDKSKCIYGINELKKLKQSETINEIVIVEGQMDVISLYKSGIKNAVACMGTALTSSHAKNLKRFADKVILCFDGDSAGKKATLRSIEILVNAGISVYVVSIPNGNDPDEFVNLYGKSEWDKLMGNALYWVEFLIKDFASNRNLDRMEEKNKFINDSLNVIRTLPTQSEQEIYLKMVQDLSKVTMNVLKSDLENITTNTDIKQDEINDIEDNQINLKENAYVKAVKFVISALLHKKDYATLSDDVKENLLNPDYVKIYEYVKEEYDAGRIPIVSKLFDMFDVEGSKDIYDIVNYVFSSGDDNEKYYNDCVKNIVKSGLSMQKNKLLSQIAASKDTQEKTELIHELQKLILKEKNNK